MSLCARISFDGGKEGSFCSRRVNKRRHFRLRRVVGRSDNNAFEALIADYFTGSVDDSSEESEDDDIGISFPLFN